MIRATAAASILVLATAAHAAPGVDVRNAAARMVVIPEARSDVLVEVRRGDPRLPTPVVRREGDRLVVEGGLAGRIGGCGSYGVDWRVFGDNRREPNPHVQRVSIRGVGPLTLDHLPVITARVPMRAAVTADHAVFGKVGPSAELALANEGCGDWTVGDVEGALSTQTRGSGDIHAGRAGVLQAVVKGSGDVTTNDVARDASIAIAGSGDVSIGRVGGRLESDISGSGDVAVREVNGPVASHQHGSGDVTIAGGHADSLAVDTSGSGDFIFRGDAGAVSAQSRGSGDIAVARASGPVSKSHAGSGDITVGR